MTLLTSGFLWFLLLIPIVILMYILKQKYNEQQVSSIYLWNAVLKDMEVNTPWQKLKKNLLLLLQLITIIFLVFALANPYINFKGIAANNYIIVIDNSGSMSALYNENTRFEEAKNKAINLVKTAPKKSKFSIISMEEEAKILLTNSSDISEIINSIKSLKTRNSSADINESLSLVKSIGKQYDSYKAIFFSDSSVELSDINGEFVSLALEKDNVSVDYIAATLAENEGKVLVKVTNRSNSDVTRELAIYDINDTLLNVKDMNIKAGETKTEIFQMVLNNTKAIYAEISEKDGLIEDNRRYYVINQPKTKKALLVTNKNLFIEKSLSSVNNLELFKTTDINSVDDNYDLYIFDGMIPEKMPHKGSIFVINPEGNSEFYAVRGNLSGGVAEIEENNVTKYMEKADFSISEIKDIEFPYWGKSIIKVNDSSVAFVGEYKGRNIGVLAFDLHNSNFPLIAEFPIFINNITNYFLGASFSDRISYFCGEKVKINAIEQVKDMYIIKPNNEKEGLDLEYPIKDFDDTAKPGVYKLIQNIESENIENLFSVNFPAEKESNINKELVSQENKAQNYEDIRRLAFSIQPYLILLALMILLGEWWVYLRS
ncbi:BatA domain-containing protein [Clostridium grantii]|uniref:N-terminal double-transmembrane domain-containing protein n=1 Tax=Clostridium grantii DSM 8605 TaxID=1121316 RepID=A0A1M5XAJ7_9CLOT|nr:BatA domain-containing protein [Clostridium grantii]SHH96895.1 N-terminal double-transmembrane domain-containing protein [Clostridium grantii DSM 8605]